MTNLAQEWAKYSPEITSFASKVDSVLKFVSTNKTIEGLAKHIPEAPHILAALGLASADIGVILQYTPYVGQLIALYESYKALGGRPMDANQIAKMNDEDGGKAGLFPEYQG